MSPRSFVASTPTHLALAVVRITFFTVLFLDFAQLYHYRLLSFAGAPGWVPGLALPAALVAIAALALGAGTRVAAVAAYVLTHVVYRYCTATYHLDDYARAFLFLFLVAPAPRALALDLRLRRRAAEPQAPIPVWFYLAFFAAMELVYADSVLFKAKSELWQRGLAVWMPAAIPHFSMGRLPDALELALPLRAGSYLALALEVLFPLVLLRAGRVPVVLVGIGLHLGTAFFFPIPFFGVAVSCTYLLFVDWSAVGRALVALRSRVAPDAAVAGESPPPIVPARIVPRDCVPALALLALQLSLVFGERLPPSAQRWSDRLCRYAGVSRHPIYIDPHFAIREPILRFEATHGGRAIRLPSFDAKGYPEMTGRYWCMVAFSLRAHGPNPAVDPALRTYLAGLLRMQGVPEADITISGKDVWVPFALDFAADDEVERRPFTPLGTARYREGVVTLW